MSYLLDTDGISQTSKDRPAGGVLGWLGTVSHESVFLSVITLAEVRRGIQLLPQGKRREALDEWLLNDVADAYRGRILPVTEAIADLAGRVGAAAKQNGYTVELSDVLIAATARVHGLTLATLNRKHFERLGVNLVTF